MKRTLSAALALAGCMLLAQPQAADANSDYRDGWRADYPDVCTPLYNLNCAVCHTSVPALNVYGQDIATYGSGPLIELMDSDGDGYTNGQEIVVDCTNPALAGDHGTVPADGTSWSAIKVLYR